jgi:hypothetical protein
VACIATCKKMFHSFTLLERGIVAGEMVLQRDAGRPAPARPADESCAVARRVGPANKHSWNDTIVEVHRSGAPGSADSVCCRSWWYALHHRGGVHVGRWVGPSLRFSSAERSCRSGGRARPLTVVCGHSNADTAGVHAATGLACTRDTWCTWHIATPHHLLGYHLRVKIAPMSSVDSHGSQRRHAPRMR